MFSVQGERFICSQDKVLNNGHAETQVCSSKQGTDKLYRQILENVVNLLKTSVCAASRLRFKGDPKTLTPGPWTSPMNRVHGPPHGPVHGPPIRTTPTAPSKNSIEKKMNKK